jgi:hypothetical protein
VTPEAVTQCPEGSVPAIGPGWCTCTDASGAEKSFKSTDKLPEYCAKVDPQPVVDSCDQYPPLKVGAELNEDCMCVNKKGEVTGQPKEDQPNFFQKLFNSKANRQFKDPSLEDGTRKSKKSTNNDQQREYSCKFGPNWWVVGGVAAGIGVLTYFAFKKKTKTVTNTVIQNTVTNNPICKTPPKTYWTGKSCECAPCGVYYMANGTSTTIVPNPRTCACTPPPTEGGSGNPNDDSGGIPNDSGTTK